MKEGKSCTVVTTVAVVVNPTCSLTVVAWQLSSVSLVDTERVPVGASSSRMAAVISFAGLIDHFCCKILKLCQQCQPC